MKCPEETENFLREFKTDLEFCDIVVLFSSSNAEKLILPSHLLSA